MVVVVCMHVTHLVSLCTLLRMSHWCTFQQVEGEFVQYDLCLSMTINQSNKYFLTAHVHYAKRIKSV